MSLKETLPEIIKNAYFLIYDKDTNKRPVFPCITISPYGRRSEGSENPYQAVIDEPRPEHLPSPSNKDGANSRINHPAAPHTPEEIELNNEKYPAHLIVWWYGENNESREYPTIIDLAQMQPENRKPFLEAIANQIRNAVLFLKEQIPNIKQEEIHRYVEIYGLGGHTKPDERKRTGSSRGAQSHPMGHINVAYHPYEKYKRLAEEKSLNPREFLKQVGPMDTDVFYRWHPFISTIIREIILKNDSLEANVISTETHKIGEKCISFYEGFTIEFINSLNLVDTLEILCQVVDFFQGIYDILRSGYNEYYQHIGDGKKTLSEKKQIIFDRIKSYFNSQLKREVSYFYEFINEIIDFTLNFHPTYQQLLLWQQLDDVSQQTKDHLARMQKTYEKIQQIIKDPEKKQRLIKWLQRIYGFNPFEAEAYLQFFIDMTSSTAEDQWKNIEFTWADQLSISYLLNKYSIDENGNIQVDELTIASRFFTNKGVFEDLAGMVINRPQGI